MKARSNSRGYLHSQLQPEIGIGGIQPLSLACPTDILKGRNSPDLRFLSEKRRRDRQLSRFTCHATRARGRLAKQSSQQSRAVRELNCCSRLLFKQIAVLTVRPPFQTPACPCVSTASAPHRGHCRATCPRRRGTRPAALVCDHR